MKPSIETTGFVLFMLLSYLFGDWAAMLSVLIGNLVIAYDMIKDFKRMKELLKELEHAD